MPKRWTEEEDVTIREHYPVSTAKQLMRLLPGRTESAIQNRIHKIGLTLVGLRKNPGSTGYKHTEPARQRIAEKARRRWQDPDYCKMMSKKMRNIPKSEEHKKKLRDANTGKILSKERRKGISDSLRGNIRALGYIHNESTRKKVSESSLRNWQDPDYRERHSKRMQGNIYALGSKRSPDVRQKMSDTIKGENHPNWQGGISFEPYCPKFDFGKKEEIRNRDNRACVLCGKSEILDGRRLSVHHIDGNKAQGCNGVPWYLCALCRSCNGEKDTIEKEFLIVANPVHQLYQ